MVRIGYRIKDLRARQRITLKGLAERTGLTTSFLSQLERDLVSPSVSSLEKIALALNTKVGYFFEREEGKELVFIKRGVAKKIPEKEVYTEASASGVLNIKMEPKIFTLGIGAELAGELIYSAGEKFGMAIKGKVKLVCGLEDLILEEGDTIYCAYTRGPERLINIGEGEAKFLWIIFR